MKNLFPNSSFKKSAKQFKSYIDNANINLLIYGPVIVPAIIICPAMYVSAELLTNDFTGIVLANLVFIFSFSGIFQVYLRKSIHSIYGKNLTGKMAIINGVSIIIPAWIGGSIIFILVFPYLLLIWLPIFLYVFYSLFWAKE